MAEIKKYLDTTALGTLVDQIKSEDAKGLQAAKDYADGLAKNYETAGAAATALSNAKAYTDELANGQVATNKAAIETLNGTGEGSVAKAVADAKALVDADVDAVEAIANKNKEDIAAINNAESGILKQAKDYADSEVAKVQGAVDELGEYVGTIPVVEGEETPATIVAYVQKKTAGIATSDNLAELSGRVAQVETDIDNIEKDYLKAADKTELEGKITAEETARTEADAGLASRIKVVEDDYLKAADKTELTNAIATAKQEAIETILGEGEISDKFDTLKEVADWIRSDTTGAAALQTKVSTLETEMDTVEGKVSTLEGEMDDVQSALDTKVEQEAYNTKIAALEGADAGQVERIAALEAKFGEGEGSVEDQIADAKSEAISEAVAQAETKDAEILKQAKAYADEEDAKIVTRVDALESASHTHSNKALLDTYTQTEADLADAVAKKHEHSNLSVLEGITSAKVTAWDAAEGNAKTYADGLNSTMTAKVDGIDTRVKAIEEVIDDKAEADDLDAAVARIAANETAIAANTSAINSFTAITPDEVNALFA